MVDIGMPMHVYTHRSYFQTNALRLLTNEQQSNELNLNKCTLSLFISPWICVDLALNIFNKDRFFAYPKSEKKNYLQEHGSRIFKQTNEGKNMIF